MAACGDSGRRVTLFFNFSCNFYQRHCVVLRSQKRCQIVSRKELLKEENDVVESQKKRFYFQIKISVLYWNDLKYMFELFRDATCFVVMYKWPSNLIPSNQNFLQTIFAKWFAIAWKIYNAVKFFRIALFNIKKKERV